MGHHIPGINVSSSASFPPYIIFPYYQQTAGGNFWFSRLNMTLDTKAVNSAGNAAF